MRHQHIRVLTLSGLVAFAILVVGIFILNQFEGELSIAQAGETTATATKTAQAAKTIQWHPYKEGLELAESQNKKLYLYFFSNRCFYCSMMEKKTFTDAPTVDFLNESFTAVRLNTDENTELAGQFNILGVPVSIFLDENGDLIGSRPGYLPPEEFIKLLHFVDAELYKK